jgi:hypothetical protein
MTPREVHSPPSPRHGRRAATLAASIGAVSVLNGGLFVWFHEPAPVAPTVVAPAAHDPPGRRTPATIVAVPARSRERH